MARPFFRRPMLRKVARTAAAIGTAGASEVAIAAARAAQGKEVNLQRTALSLLTGGASELAYGARGATPGRDRASGKGSGRGGAARPPDELYAPPPGRVYPQRRPLGRAAVGLAPRPGMYPPHLTPPPGRLYPQRRYVGRRVAGLPADLD